jgi:hypothetical protein
MASARSGAFKTSLFMDQDSTRFAVPSSVRFCTRAALKEFVLKDKYGVDPDHLAAELVDQTTRYLRVESSTMENS